MCRLPWNLVDSTFWNPQGLSRPLKGLHYIYRELCSFRKFTVDFITDGAWNVIRNWWVNVVRLTCGNSQNERTGTVLPTGAQHSVTCTSLPNCMLLEANRSCELNSIYQQTDWTELPQFAAGPVISLLQACEAFTIHSWTKMDPVVQWTVPRGSTAGYSGLNAALVCRNSFISGHRTSTGHSANRTRYFQSDIQPTGQGTFGRTFSQPDKVLSTGHSANRTRYFRPDIQPTGQGTFGRTFSPTQFLLHTKHTSLLTHPQSAVTEATQHASQTQLIPSCES
jgi:hypothetical protein